MQEIKYQGNYITVTEEDIDGHIYERVLLRKGVQVIPYQNGKILLIHEKRAHEKNSRWKLVSGWCDKENTSILDHAKGELAEEVGMQAQQWTEIGNTVNLTTTMNPNTHYFACSGVSELELKPHNPDTDCEVLESKWFSFDEIFNLVEEEKILTDDTMMRALAYLYTQNKKQSN